MKKQNYQAQRYFEKNETLKKLIGELPDFVSSFFRGIENTTSILTRVNYAYELRLFFNYLCFELKLVQYDNINKVNIDDLKGINSEHIEKYLEYSNCYYDGEGLVTNSEYGKSRKLSAIRSFFKYYFRKGQLPSNVASLVQLPKIHEKPIIRLEADEVANLLDMAETGEDLSPAQLRYHKFNKTRDVAILTLFLGTGIRISELVGINITDIDFRVNGFRVTRKGGSQAVLYFGGETEKALKDYLTERRSIQAKTGDEDALFLSMQKTRISVRNVQNLVVKYARIVSPLKKISPHKLRSTYGTMLYQETGDIYLVADVLGHKDVNTTKKHYAAISDEKRRMAAKAVKLRDE